LIILIILGEEHSYEAYIYISMYLADDHRSGIYDLNYFITKNKNNAS
jgi:hypothetical protein